MSRTDPRPAPTPAAAPGSARPTTATGALTAFATGTVDLAAGTVSVWARLWPQLTVIWIGGWLVSELATRIATQIPLELVWLALAVFALGLLGTLGAIVLMLRVVARALDIDQLVPPEEAGRGHGQSLSHVLALTLLPFLGIYAAVNEVAARAEQLTNLALLQSGIVADRTILTELNPLTSPGKTAFVVGLIVTTYLVRRGVDLLHHRVGWRWLGVVVTLLEAYFLLVVILSGQHVLRAAKDWWQGRTVLQWFDQMGVAIAGLAEQLGIRWPALVAALGRFVSDVLWPLTLDALVQPVVWLAVAALVYGSKLISLAELWQKGLESRARALAPRQVRRLRALEASRGRPRLERLWIEFREAFLSDLDDKYLPTFHSLRLVLRAGIGFLGSYVLVHALWTVVDTAWTQLVIRVIGGHEVMFWLTWQPFVALVEGLTEPLRMCLLAVAFHRCLVHFRERVPTAEKVRR